MAALKICSVCDKGSLRPDTYDETFKFNGKPLHVSGLQYSLCDNCDADPILSDQISFNQVLVTDAKRKSLNLLTSDEIKSLRKRFNLTQQEAAEVFGGGEHAFSKYERGEVIQSEPMDKLLRVALNHPGVLNDLMTNTISQVARQQSQTISAHPGGS
ncbi:MAG: type II toxin-antitoxin system MqsA family antitoxin [Pseudohongiellaceae bacterium]